MPLGGLPSEIREQQNGHFKEKNLEQISAEAGRHILRFAGSVRGSDEQLDQAVRDFGNHALAINLLSAWLYTIPGHSIEKAADIPDLPDVPEEKGKHPRRVVAAFAGWLHEQGKALRAAKERAEAALSELATHKAALDEHAIVAVMDASGKISYANSRLCAVTGYSEEELQVQVDQLADRLGVDGTQAIEDVEAYVAGINQYIDDVQSDIKDLEPAESRIFVLPVSTERRGWIRLERFGLRTLFPFELFRS